MSMITLPDKPVGETSLASFDFISQLAAGETLTGAVVTASVFSGVDGTPENIISGAEILEGTIVSQMITGGVAGVVYWLSCSVSTSTGQNLIMQAFLAVTSTNPYAGS